MCKYKFVIEHDDCPDFSWLEQEHYNPASPEYSPVYPSEEAMQAGKDAYDPDWYRNPENHVALCVLLYTLPDDAEDWQLIDSLGNIDFLVDSDDWTTGTFYRLESIPEGYLREVAAEMLGAVCAK